MNITKRILLSGLAVLPFLGRTETVLAQTNKSYTVPDGVTRIRVQAYDGDKEVLNTVVRVKPKQVFVFTPLENS